MDDKISTQKKEQTSGQRSAVILFVIAALAMTVAVTSGLFLDEELLASFMRVLQENRLPIGEFHPRVMGRIALFAFGLPLGLVALSRCSAAVCCSARSGHLKYGH